jgi:hypothetical protein
MIKVVWPERISLNYWAACLVTDYPSENLPLLESDENWQEWATIVSNTGIFLKAHIPAPVSVKDGVKKELFHEWDKWAKVVYTIMSDEYSIPQTTR